MAEQNQGGTAVVNAPKAPNADAQKAKATQEAARKMVPYFSIEKGDKTLTAFSLVTTQAVLSRIAKNTDNSGQMYRYEEMVNVLKTVKQQWPTFIAALQKNGEQAIENLIACMDPRTKLKGGLSATDVTYNFLGYRFKKDQVNKDIVRGILGNAADEEAAE